MALRYLCGVFFTLLTLLSTLLFSTTAAAQGLGENSTYKLASGDIIRIHVFGEPDLSFEEIRLTDAGTFSYPFLGEVRARGKTANELARDLTAALQGDFWLIRGCLLVF